MALHLTGQCRDATPFCQRLVRLREEFSVVSRIPVRPVARAALGYRCILPALLTLSFVEQDALRRRELVDA